MDGNWGLQCHYILQCLQKQFDFLELQDIHHFIQKDNFYNDIRIYEIKGSSLYSLVAYLLITQIMHMVCLHLYITNISVQIKIFYTSRQLRCDISKYKNAVSSCHTDHRELTGPDRRLVRELRKHDMINTVMEAEKGVLSWLLQEGLLSCLLL